MVLAGTDFAHRTFRILDFDLANVVHGLGPGHIHLLAKRKRSVQAKLVDSLLVEARRGLDYSDVERRNFDSWVPCRIDCLLVIWAIVPGLETFALPRLQPCQPSRHLLRYRCG